MDFLKFTVGATNIFPIANSHLGGQLINEWNLRSRESVNTDPNVQYFIGPSFTHGPEDFAISQQLGSSTIIELAPGRAVVNGHYIESLAPIEIDIADANITAGQTGQPILSGELCVGLRVLYSTEATMAGSMIAETYVDESHNGPYYPGIKVVVLPKSGVNKFITPSDSPTDQSAVNAHLLLGTFQYVNGAISGIIQNDAKYKNIDASRVTNIEQLVSDEYISKLHLNPQKLYVFSGKGTDPSTGYDTWCEANDSLMIWDKAPVASTTRPSNECKFVYDPLTGSTHLLLAHKQVDGMVNASDEPLYYKDKLLTLPSAHYNRVDGGVVTPEYTAHIHDIDSKVNKLYMLPPGDCKQWIDSITSISELPTIQSGWQAGDYVVVSQDNTLVSSTEAVTAPSTLYMVLPGIVTTIERVGSDVTPPADPPSPLDTGIQIASAIVDPSGFDPTDILAVKSALDWAANTYRGRRNIDYFTIITSDNSVQYFYKVSDVDSTTMKYAEPPIRLTSEIQLATETTVGGFYNVSSTALDGGYVYLDESGHLRLAGYEFLISDLLSDQLGESIQLPSNITAAEIQAQLDEYVNNRIAFPADSATNDASITSVIDVDIYLSVEDEASVIDIRNIDSRFNTAVRIKIHGEADSHTTINISDCQKVKLELLYSGTPVVNLYRSGLWYDADVLSQLNVIDGLSLWYNRFATTDANILVDGMTVTQLDLPQSVETVDYWNETAVNDNHYKYAVKSLTFGSDGYIIGCALLVGDDITGNISDGTYLYVFNFELPQSLGLQYPVNRVNKKLKVSGSYLSAYPIISPTGYKVNTTTFSALTNTYDAATTGATIQGSIAFQTVVNTVTIIQGVDPGTAIDPIQSGTYHLFSGGTVE